MITKASVAVIFGIFLMLVDVSLINADRLILRVSGQIMQLGEGNLDAKKENVLFRKCKETKAEPFSLKDYEFRAGKDCEPPIWGLQSVNIDGTVTPVNFTKCSTGQPCLRYTVNSARALEKIFVKAKEGDKIELEVSNVKETPSARYKDIDLILRLVEPTGGVRQTLTYHKVSASDEFVAKAMAKE